MPDDNADGRLGVRDDGCPSGDSHDDQPRPRGSRRVYGGVGIRRQQLSLGLRYDNAVTAAAKLRLRGGADHPVRGRVQRELGEGGDRLRLRRAEEHGEPQDMGRRPTSRCGG